MEYIADDLSFVEDISSGYFLHNVYNFVDTVFSVWVSDIAGIL